MFSLLESAMAELSTLTTVVLLPASHVLDNMQGFPCIRTRNCMSGNKPMKVTLAHRHKDLYAPKPLIKHSMLVKETLCTTMKHCKAINNLLMRKDVLGTKGSYMLKPPIERSMDTKAAHTSTCSCSIFYVQSRIHVKLLHYRIVIYSLASCATVESEVILGGTLSAPVSPSRAHSLSGSAGCKVVEFTVVLGDLSARRLHQPRQAPACE